MPRVNRRPTHAGSWYEDEERTLSKQIEGWMAAVKAEPGLHARALIGPHAGYRYCGHVMAHAYKHIDPSRVSRVFLLGPSHHVATRKCLLSTATAYDTPLGSMPIDQEVYDELRGSGLFEDMPLHVDEAEHSLELHSPFIVAALQGRPFTLVPIMVGALRPDSEAAYGKLLGPYLDDPSNLFVLSSDFCHWGARFAFTFMDPSKGSIWQSIQWLDHEGMAIIEKGEPKAFTEYLAQYGNTICGRHPIGVFLNMLQHCSTRHKIQFRNYDQSSKATRPEDSSVSYASAIVTAADA